MLISKQRRSNVKYKEELERKRNGRRKCSNQTRKLKRKRR